MRPVNGSYILRVVPPARAPDSTAANFLPRFLCRLRFLGLRGGSIQGVAQTVPLRVDAPTLSTPPEDVKSDDDGTAATPAVCNPSFFEPAFFEAAGTWHWDTDGISHVRLSLKVKRRPSAKQKHGASSTSSSTSSPSQTLETVHVTGTLSGRWFSGAFIALSSSGAVWSLYPGAKPNNLRCVLQEVPPGPVCTSCLIPLTLVCSDVVVGGGAAAEEKSGAGFTTPISSLSVPQLYMTVLEELSSADTSLPPPIPAPCGCKHIRYCSHHCCEQHNYRAPGRKKAVEVASSSSLIPQCEAACKVSRPYSAAADATVCFTILHEHRPFAGWWRSLSPTSFSIFVDAGNPFGRAYEVRLDLLIDARCGLAVSFASAPSPSSHGDNETEMVDLNATTGEGQSLPFLSESDLMALNYLVFEAVVYSAIRHNCIALAAAALNQLFAWCDYADHVERLFLHFYDTVVGNGWEGQRIISSLGEFVMLVRPIYEAAAVLLECALKSQLASDFWFRLENAKGVLISLYNLNGTVTFTPTVQSLRNAIVPEQQRQTLLLLARVFITMAMRTTPEVAPKMLRRAEECYRDALDEDKCRNNYRRMGHLCSQLATLYLLFPSEDDRAKAQPLRDQGLQYLAQSVRPSTGPERLPAAVNVVTSLILHGDESFSKSGISSKNKSLMNKQASK